jgi:hypothetical protein
MTTTIDLTDQELAELKAVTRQSDAGDAIRFATTEYLRLVRRQRLKELSGRVEMEENWRVLEEADLKRQNDSG